MHKRVGYLGIENQQDSVYEDRWGFMDMSNMTKNNKIIACIKMVIGISMPIAVLIGYLPIPEYLVEFTCISNTLGGLLLVADGVLNLRGKSVPGVFYRNISVGIFFVFAICMGSLSGAYHMNFKGAFFYLHQLEKLSVFSISFYNINKYKCFYHFQTIYCKYFFLNNQGH